jgi:hypothetical protein
MASKPELTSRTAHDDAPLSAARSPDPEVASGHLEAEKGDVLIGRSVTIDRPRQELYAFWRDLERLPLFMHNIKSITVIDAVYGGVTDKFPIGALMEKGLSVKSGQTHVQKYTPDLLKMIVDGELDTTFLISHRMSLEEAPQGYKIFKERQNEVTKVVLKPGAAPASSMLS